VASSRIVPEFQAAAPPVAGRAARHAARRSLLPGLGARRGLSREGAGGDPAARAPSWRPFVSARSRILGWSVLLLATAMAVSTVATHVLLVSRMNTRVSAELTHEIAEFQALAARRSAAADGQPDSVLALLRARASQAVLERDTVLIGVIGGKIVATSTNSSPDGVEPSPAQLAQWSAITTTAEGTAQLGAGPARYIAVPVHGAGSPARGTFIAAVLTGADQAEIARVAQLQLEVGAIALLLGSGLAWLAAGRVLRPVRDTTELARRITDTDLSGRIPAHGRNEVSELAVTFNRMLDRLEAALITQRRFLADAGHELRTPITVIQGNLDTLTVTAPDDAQTLAIAADELSRMTRLVDELTLLASSERPDFLCPEPADLAALTRSLVVKAEALDGRPWVLAGTASGTAMLDPQRITQAVMQLAANAVAHTQSGTVVEIGSAVTGNRVEFTVADHGQGIPAASAGRVFDRFARLDSRRTGGTGLGLSIVAAIGVAHGDGVRLAERPGGGASFCLSIPFIRPPGKEAPT
jgi:two-component system, OmpR family, sensor kinase